MSSTDVIGIYCGSFNPIHTGHAIIANYVGQYSSVEEVWLMVSRLNPLKEEKPMADLHRLRMAEIVANNCRNVKVSDFEFGLPSPSYTYTTLTALKKKYEGKKFKLIIGSDNWLRFNDWRNSKEIIEEFGLIVYPRPDFEIEKIALHENIEILKGAPQLHISSTLIRQMIKHHRNINYMVPVEVADYIKKYNLYI